MSTKPTLEQFCEHHPVRQDTMSGKYGWRRVGGCINTNAMGFATETDAELDREMAWRKARADDFGIVYDFAKAFRSRVDAPTSQAPDPDLITAHARRSQMSILTAPPPCSCCDTVRQYIADHLDRDGLIKPTDDPSETLAIFDRCFAEDGGSGLDLKDVAAYIEELGEDAMLENGDD